MQKTLAHYTNLEAIHGIIQGDGLHFRATRYDKLNDPIEYKWLYEPLKKELAKKEGLSEEELNDLYEKFPYVISFTEREDDAALWKRYSRKHDGITMVLDYNSIEPTPEQLCGEGAEWDVLLQIHYANEDNKMEILSKATEDFRQFYGTENKSEEFEDEIYSCAFVKEEGKWSVEKEWRYARIRERTITATYNEEQGPEFSYPEDTHGVEHYSRGNEQIPYLEVKFKPQSLLEVIIGSKLNFEEESLKVRKLLNSFGDRYTGVNIEKSNVEY